MMSSHVLSSVTLLAEPLPTLVTTERLDVQMDDLVVAVVLGFAAFPVKYPVTDVTPPLHCSHCGIEGWFMYSAGFM